VVETWLVPLNPWHVRLHRITTPRDLQTSEGGFPIERADFNADIAEAEMGRAVCHGQQDVSAIVDLSPAIQRSGVAHQAIANTNLIHGRTLVPQLRGTVTAGETILITTAIALPAGEHAQSALFKIPHAPDLKSLEDMFRQKGQRVAAFALDDAPTANG
jgi:hypothetical protein